MEQHYQIGEAARRAGVTVETLRHYDRIGLVTPSQVDPQSGYRYYTDAEIDQVQVIRYLRSIRFSLPQQGEGYRSGLHPPSVGTCAPSYFMVPCYTPLRRCAIIFFQSLLTKLYICLMANFVR